METDLSISISFFSSAVIFLFFQFHFKYIKTQIIAIIIFTIVKDHQTQFIHQFKCIDNIKAIGSWTTNIETIHKIIAKLVFQAALKTQVNANCIHIIPKEKADILIKSTQVFIVSLSFTNNSIKNGAKININNQIISNATNVISVQVFAIWEALFRFQAHIFCQTIVEIAIENHIVGIKINWKIFHQAQNQAKATVQK